MDGAISYPEMINARWTASEKRRQWTYASPDANGDGAVYVDGKGNWAHVTPEGWRYGVENKYILPLS